MKDLVILGGGTAGTMIANKLRHRLDQRGVEHHRRRPRRRAPLPARLPVPAVRWLLPRAGGPVAARVPARRRRLRRRRGRPGRRRRRTSYVLEGGRELRLRLARHRHRHDPAARPDARHARARVAAQHLRLLHPRGRGGARRARSSSFDHGRLVVHITEMPIKCPVAPLEFTFLAEAWLRERGLRDRVELVFVTPLDGAFTQPVASAHLGGDARGAQGRTSRPTSWSSGSTPSGRCSSPTTSARSRSTCS